MTIAQGDFILAADILAMGNVLPAIPGAVTRSLAARSVDQMSVLDFGVTGTNPAADTAAYQAALNNCAGKCALLHPAGLTVTTSAVLTIPAGTELILNGTLFLQSATNDHVLMITGSDVLVHGVGTINGNKAGQTSGGVNFGAGGIVTQLATYPAVPYSNIAVRGLTILDCYNWPVSLNSVSDGEVSECTIGGSGNSPQFANGSVNCRAFGNTITTITDYFFALYQGASYCSVTDNFCDGGGIAILNDGTLPFGGSTAFYSGMPQHGHIIARNRIKNASNYSIFISNVTTLLAANSYDNSVDANIIENSGISAGANASGICMGTGVYSISITRNLIRGGGTAGQPWFGICGACTFGNIAGNEIGNGGSAASGIDSFAIQVAGLGYCRVSDNWCYDDQTTPTMKYMFGDDTGGGGGIVSTGTILTGNNCSATVIPFKAAVPFAVNAGAFFGQYSQNSNFIATTSSIGLLPAPGPNQPSPLVQLQSMGPTGAVLTGSFHLDTTGAFNFSALFRGVQISPIASGSSQPSGELQMNATNSAGANIIGYFDLDASGNVNAVLPGSSGNLTSTTGIAINGAGGPSWTSGVGVPSDTQPTGSLRSRIDGAIGSRLYVSAGAGVWNAVAGV